MRFNPLQHLRVLIIALSVVFPLSGTAEIQWRMTSSNGSVLSPPGSDPRAVCEAYGSTWQGIGGETVPGYASSFSLTEGSFVASCHVNSRDHRAGIQLYVSRTGNCDDGEVEYKGKCEIPAGNQCPQIGNPIQVSSGNKYQEEVDYQGAGTFPLTFSRYYNSSLGYWRHTYSRSIEVSAGQSAVSSIPVVSGEYLLDLPTSVIYSMDTGFRSRFALPTVNGVSEAQLVNITAGSAQVVYEGITGRADLQLHANVDLTPYTSSEPGYEAITQKAVLTGFEIVNANDDVETYDDSGLLSTIVQRGGLSLNIVQTTTDMTVSDDFGRQLVVEYGFNDGSLYNNNSPLPYTLKSLTTPDGAVYTYESAYLHTETLSGGGTVDWAGNVSVVFPAEPGQSALTRLYSYTTINEKSLLSGITDERGVGYVSWVYDGDGRASSSTNLGGVGSHSMVFNADESTTTTNPLGKETIFHFDTVYGQRRLTSVEGVASANCAGAVKALSYDDLGFVTSKTDWNNNVTTQTYDDRGRMLTIDRASGSPEAQLTTTTWHSTYRLPVSVSTPDTVTTFTYDSVGNRTSMSVANNAGSETRTTTWTYNALGQMLTADGPRTDVNDVTTYSYYSCTSGAQCGQLHTVSNALGHTTTFDTYDAHGYPLSMTDANGTVTQITYDHRQRVKSTTIDSSVTTLSYDASGNMTRMSLPDGTYMDYVWDVAHRLVGIADSQGNLIEWTLDNAGNRTVETIKTPSGQVTKSLQRSFDELSRLIGVTAHHGGVTQYTFDANGNQTGMTDASSRATVRTFDALNRLVSIQDALLAFTTLAYDTQNNVTSVTDPEGLTTTYTYNSFGNQLSVSSPDSGTTTYTYDVAGNRTSQTDARGVTAIYSYDALNRLTSMIYPDAAENITYVYDSGAHGVGRLASLTDQSGSTSFDYDPRGNVASVTQVVDGQSYTTGYSYNGANRLTGVTYPNGRQLTYQYDTSGRIEAVTSTHNGAVETLVSGITRLPFGPLTSMTLGNGITRTHSFDLDYRISNILDNGVLERNYGYSAVDNITAITDTLSTANSQFFTYDSLNRLDFASGDYGDISYSYDGIGNRLSRSVDTGGNTSTETYTYGSGSHRLTSVNGVGYQYDNVGNTLDNGNVSFTYNDRNRMASASVAGDATSYAYNALGQRVRKTNTSIDTHYHYDLNGLLISEADSSGNIDVEYAYLDGQPLAMWVESSVTNPCGPMTYDAAVDRALLVWQECDGTFHVVGAGGNAGAEFIGEVASDFEINNLTLYSVESSDTVVIDPAHKIQYDITLGGIWVDEFSFTTDSGASICLALNSSSSGTSILVGANRIPVTSPFDPVTLQSCTIPVGPDCGSPNVDATVDPGIHVWQECGGPWNLMLTGVDGLGSSVNIEGAIYSELGLTSVTAQSVESSDTLDATDLTAVVFDLTTAHPWDDRFEFESPAGDDMCIDIPVISSNLTVHAGANRIPVTPPFNPATLESCTLPGPGSCGNPSLDSAVDEGLFIWKDCQDTWTLAITGFVAGGVPNFVGSISSTLDFTSITPLSIESSDTLSSDLTQPISFDLRTSNPWDDQFEFTVDSAADLCVNVTSLAAGMTIYAGPNRTPVSAPFNPVTLASCT